MRRVAVPLAVVLLALGAPVAAEASVAAQAAATPARGAAPIMVAFDASGSTADAAIVAYDWDFGDGSGAAGVTVSHEYASAGSYVATLTVTDANGESGTATVEITAQTISLALAPARVVYGSLVSANGLVAPTEEGLAVVVERLNALGAWEALATAATDAAGSFAVSFVAAGHGPIRARLEETGAMSGEQALSVVPKVVVNTPTGRAFLGARLVADVAPTNYTGRVLITVVKYDRVVGRARATVMDGRLRMRIPTPGLGRFSVRLAFPAGGDLDARRVSTRAYATARTLRVGSRGADVLALHRRLKDLRFRIPGLYRYFSSRTLDSVVAFQKTWGLPRTGVVGAQTWSMLGRVRAVRPRYSAPFLHIEIDKSRQILMIVRGGNGFRRHSDLERRDRQHPGRSLPNPLEGACDEHVAGVGDPLPNDDVSRQLRDSRLLLGPRISRESRLREGADVARRLALRPVVRGGARLRLSVGSRGSRG